MSWVRRVGSVDGRPVGPQADIAGDRVRRAAGQLARRPQAACQVKGFEDLHGLSGRLHGVPPPFLGSQQPQ
jgi:hypothetical protein